MPTRFPCSESVPQAASEQARMPWKTPSAVSTLESPAPPFATVLSGDVCALAGDHVHVLAVGANVTGCEVATMQGLDEPAIGAQQMLGLVTQRIADDDGFATAEIETREGCLVGHSAGQIQHVDERVGLRWIGVEAGAAEAGPECGRVDGDDRAKAARGVVAEHDLLVLVGPSSNTELRRCLRSPLNPSSWSARGSTQRPCGAARPRYASRRANLVPEAVARRLGWLVCCPIRHICGCTNRPNGACRSTTASVDAEQQTVHLARGRSQQR